MHADDLDTLSQADRQLFARLHALEAEAESLSIPVEGGKITPGVLTVLDSVYPGVTIYIGDHCFPVSESLGAVVYQLKKDGSEIEAVPLKER